MRHVLSAIAVPTLVLQNAEDNWVPVESGRELAGLIPGSTYVEVPIRGHIPALADMDVFLEPIESFLRESWEGRPQHTSPTACSRQSCSPTSSTRPTRTASAGRPRLAGLLERHHEIVRARARAGRGREVDTARATASSPPSTARRAPSAAPRRSSRAWTSSASTSASGCTRASASSSTGRSPASPCTPARRVAAHAGAGEVLVSSTVRDLVAGSGLEFDDRGVHELKGIPGEWRLYAAVELPPRRRASRSSSPQRRRARPHARSRRPRPAARGAARASPPLRRRQDLPVEGSPPGPTRESAATARRRRLTPRGTRTARRPRACARGRRSRSGRAGPGSLAISSPRRRCSSRERSRAGATTTTRFARRKLSGTSVPQSSGISACSTRLPPYETPRIGSSMRRSAAAVSRSTSHSPTCAAVTTAKWRSTWTLCGVTTIAVSAPAASNRRPSSSIAARSCGISSRSPCGAMHAKTRLTAARLSGIRAARGTARRRRRLPRPRSAHGP